MMVSIIMPVYNDENYIESAVTALLNQTYADFELIIVNDHSTDNTEALVRKFRDPRILLVNNERNMGIAGSRNAGVSNSGGDYIFFTDSDCVTDTNWLANGLKEFVTPEVIGVEGRTFYHEEGYRPSFSDKLPGDLTSKEQYMTCNIAYQKSILEKLGGFDLKFKYHEDRNLALKAQKLGRIVYSDSMIVTHMKKIWTISSYVKSAKRSADKVLLYKYNNDKSEMTWKIMSFRDFIKVLFPPLILYTVLNNEYRSWADVRLIPFIYVRHIYSRYQIWKQSIKERVLVL